MMPARPCSSDLRRGDRLRDRRWPPAVCADRDVQELRRRLRRCATRRVTARSSPARSPLRRHAEGIAGLAPPRSFGSPRLSTARARFRCAPRERDPLGRRQGARAINLSLGGAPRPADRQRPLRGSTAAIDYAYPRVVVVVAAGGNDHGRQGPWPFAHYPAPPHVIGVAALAVAGRAAVSNRDAQYVDLPRPAWVSSPRSRGHHRRASRSARGPTRAAERTSSASPTARRSPRRRVTAAAATLIGMDPGTSSPTRCGAPRDSARRSRLDGLSTPPRRARQVHRLGPPRHLRGPDATGREGAPRSVRAQRRRRRVPRAAGPQEHLEATLDDREDPVDVYRV